MTLCQDKSEDSNRMWNGTGPHLLPTQCVTWFQNHLQRSAPGLIKIHEQENEATGSKWQVSGRWHPKLAVIDTQKMALLKGQRHSSGGSFEFLKLGGTRCHSDAPGIQNAGFLS